MTRQGIPAPRELSPARVFRPLRRMRKLRVLFATIGLAVAGCAAPTSDVVVGTVVAVPSPRSRILEYSRHEDPQAPYPLREAMARGDAIAAGWNTVRDKSAETRAAFLRDGGYDERELRRVVGGLVRTCLLAQSDEAPACLSLGEKVTRDRLDDVIAVLAEMADPSVGPSPTVEMLLRLSARGDFTAANALTRVLERRHERAAVACSPPSEEEISRADFALDDFSIVTATGTLRRPRPEEREDLAYFYAAVADNGGAIGVTDEVFGDPLPKDHPDLKRRDELRAAIDRAALDGDVTEHSDRSVEYLKTLGYPGPIRVSEEYVPGVYRKTQRTVLVEAARSLELLGRYDEAERMYRRTNPQFGCTNRHGDYDRQLSGAIRSAEQAGGCRGAIAERLYALSTNGTKYGPGSLESAGLDLTRLYRAALLTLNRSDPQSLRDTIRSSPYALQAMGRLDRLGDEDWANRVRALRGFADAAKKDAFGLLLDVASTAAPADRVAAIDAIGQLAEDQGLDVCSGPTYSPPHYSRYGQRKIESLMNACETRLDERTQEKVARGLIALAADSSPYVREEVARALGRVASPIVGSTLATLSTDSFENGSICSTDAGVSVCEPNFPVRRATADALDVLLRVSTNRGRWVGGGLAVRRP